MENAIINLYVFLVLVLGFYCAIAKQSSEIYCGGNNIFIFTYVCFAYFSTPVKMLVVSSN